MATRGEAEQIQKEETHEKNALTGLQLNVIVLSFCHNTSDYPAAVYIYLIPHQTDFEAQL